LSHEETSSRDGECGEKVSEEIASDGATGSSRWLDPAKMLSIFVYRRRWQEEGMSWR
jgi:hypothetical protein